MASDLRVGLVGFGLAGQVFHAPLIETTPGLRLSGVVTADAERRARVAAEYPEAELFDDFDQMLAAGIDLAVIATPNRTHTPLALRAIAERVAVVVDKPFAPTAADGLAVTRAAEAAGVPLSVFHNRRWDSDFRTARKLVEDGTLGTPLRLESRFERWRPAVRDVWRERGDPAEAGGLLFDLGSHLIDQAVTLLGPVSRVYAELDRRRPGAEVDDDAFLALTHASGARSHLWASSVAALPGPRLRLLGDRAAFVVAGLDGQERALRNGGRPGTPGWGAEPPEAWGAVGAGADSKPVQPVPGAYQLFYQRMVPAVRDGAPVPVEPSDAVRVLEIIEAAAASARDHRLVEV